MDERINGLKNFLDASVSRFHAVAELVKALQEKGYIQLNEKDCWQLVPGGKYYLTRGGSAVMAFRIPKGAAKGFLMSASHSDQPAFKLKENGELVGKYTRLATEKYGSMIISTWLDRPLSVAGRVMVQTEKGIESRLVNIDRDLLLIPNVAIHMNRKVNEGMAWNVAVDTLALAGSPDVAGKLEKLLEETAGGKILGQDLYLYLREKASVWGMDGEYISSRAIDDLECAWCCTQGFLNAEESDCIPVLAVLDCEEVGSASAQGADSRLLVSVLERICKSCDLDIYQMLGQSFMVSADNGHAIHPNHPEYADAANAPEMNKGVVLKFNASQSYATDGASAAVFRSVCNKAGIPVQSFYNRADLPGGGTLGRISLAHVTVPTADIGLAQLAMHSAYETAGVQDALYLADAMKCYYSSSLSCPEDGCYIVAK